MNTSKHALAIACLLILSGSAVDCGGTDPEGGSAVSVNVQPLRGGTVITGATGVVDFTFPLGGYIYDCTGSMIAPNVVLAAAHCFDELGAATSDDGTVTATVNYYDPVRGRREVYSGAAEWHVYPTYDGIDPNTSSGAGEANDDMSVLVIPGTFARTTYHDYLRIYADADGPLDTNLTAYGAGRYTYSGHTDDQLRTTWFEVENVDVNHLVVDTRDLVSTCKGDSGGPLIKFATHGGVEFPLIVGVLSNAEVDAGTEGEICTNNDPPYDNSYYARVNPKRFTWIETKIGHGCREPSSRANLHFRLCFDPPFIEDVPGEGLEQAQETAIIMAVL